MENKNNKFTTRDVNKEDQFRIEVAEENQGKFFNVRALGNNRFELLDEEGSIGTVQLDEQDHAHCESQGCELDMPLLHAIREQIQFHLRWKSKLDL
jgi:hypothetical protein